MLNLITDYLSTVEECRILFDQKFGRRDLIHAWREGVIPQQGELRSGVEYQMHGVGCAVEYTDHLVDFDFANQDEVGFDAWRLWLYAEQYPERYPEYQAYDAIEAALMECLSSGAIRRVESQYPGESNNRLFKMSEAA